ncbi:zinc dependent phospholipase C family protein [Pseudodesulfovibrio thermohalotolerans]|uniref:zinc dependent phospholipase C family protein n=1 Tax=Pseudodesulfovibrio thermohalotolerans TaxID=2880651 RepID=UPI002441548E|nr:zinc dependent phospholipase C family protein [Pseudodesulfovibrio thermohalotolerans]WFS62835.1 zinc dependent phospholipase C family protein [Pseudodesulfovibrio thermohalotolerans]
MKLILILSCLFVALLPDQALAWGPGVHLALGNVVLGNLGCLPPLLAALLSRHREAFLYGSLSADIFIGKGTRIKPGHSHNWVTGFKLLRSAPDPRVTAYAYGYLTHLAADVVAHNYFVPNTLADMRSGSKLSHVYVEAQADRRFRQEHETALALLRMPNRAPDDTLLSAMHRRRLPFLVKKQLLKGSLSLTGRKSWTGSLRLADRLLHSSRVNRGLDEMFSLSENLVFDCLNELDNSPAVSFDPIGSGNLRLVREMRMKRQAVEQFIPDEDLLSIQRPLADSGQPVLGRVGS